MNIDTPRERLFSSSENNSRESSTHSNISSIPYHERMENFNTFWSEQVENDEKERLSISYATSRAEKDNMVNKTINTSSNEGGPQNNNEAPALNNLPCSQGEGEANNITNTYNSQKFANVLILYDINQPVKLNAWDREAHLMFIFGTMEFLEINSKNMSTSLLHMANFIRNRGFDQVAWEFILSIYSSGWNTLTTNENNRTIRQNIVSNFSPKINSIKPIKRAEQ